MDDAQIGARVRLRLQRLRDLDADEQMMDPDGAFPFRSLETRRLHKLQLDLLEELVGPLDRPARAQEDRTP